MRIKNIILLLTVFAAGFGTKCFMSSVGMYALSFPPVTRTHSVAPYGGVEELNRIANDPAIVLQRRVEAVFGLFAHHLSPGATSSDIKSTLTSTTWLADCSFHEVNVIGGRKVLDCPDDCATWVVLLKNKENPGNTFWQIHLALQGQGGEADVRNFLTGTGTSSFSHLERFALQYAYPLPEGYWGNTRTEVFNPWRMTVSGRTP